ncbi:hypothetical protein T552_03140 [Pneumocystis carinii B80]|uniref:HTH cro/C1-type domain-containing protein n=1 Tax=Pneumocystis carinii (strain B80) TaxID=1408658 RepID=A0A0W4ZBV3_PNEC8|nr:hypothetical protein T552_03140 [Pneumocystis carinii B80]KTW25866.1 hypothetical protein T552_03140 [Pneumocystis carinii B80]
MGETDWDSVTKIGRGVHSRTTAVKAVNGINEARRLGVVVNIEKKFYAGSNKAHKTTESQKIAKIDRENDIVPIKTSGREVGLAISKARQEKNIKQSEFAQKICEKVSVINDYENGKAIPNQQILAKMEKVLNVKLRGSGIGQPLVCSKR